MDTLTPADLQSLIAPRPGPCASLYIPIHAGGGEQDSILWKNAVREAEDLVIAAGVPGSEAADLLRPASRLLGDAAFWRAGSGGGLACFLSPGFDRLVRVATDWPKRAAVGSLFDIKPLLPWLTASGRFYVLGLSQNEVRLLRCTPHGAARVRLAGPANRAEALRRHDTDEPLTYHTFSRGAGAHEAIFQGHGVGIDDAKDDLLRYFRAVNRALHPVLKDEHAPLVVAAVEYLIPIFRQACTYAHVVVQGIPGNPERVGDRDLAERGWPLVEPIIRVDRRMAIATYHQLEGTGRTARGLDSVVPAAAAGGVGVLFVALDHDVWGRYDPATAQVKVHATPQPGDGELTNFAAVGALRHGRPVYALPAAEMPTQAALAAIDLLPMAKHGKRPGRAHRTQEAKS
jgi:hypothetical protein